MTYKSYRGKRALDLVLALLAIAILSPVMLAVAVLVRIITGRPILFRQRRPGLYGVPFACLKFRTMREARDSAGDLWPDAERLTRFGRFLRSTSLDELPELFNVMRGEMSLVGPRPLLPEYLPRYNTLQRRRHEVKPGITGWAQVNGRNALTWEQKFELDVWYVDHWSLLLDLRILWLTLLSVLQRQGIHHDDHPTMPEFLGNLEGGVRGSVSGQKGNPAGPAERAGQRVPGRVDGSQSPMNKLIIWGAAGHGKAVLDIVRATGVFREIAFVDDACAAPGACFFDCEVLSAFEGIEMLKARGHRCFVVAIGDNRARKRCFQEGVNRGLEPALLIHPSAVVSASARIGGGTVVMPHVVINAAAEIGCNCILNTGVIVEHDCRIADHVHLAPRVTLGGGVTVESHALVGIGAIALPRARIGEDAIIGAGAVVLDLVPPGATAVGVPAKVLSSARASRHY